MKTNKRAFSIAEALITLMIVSLILAAVIPVVSRRQATADTMWRYITAGTGANSDIAYGLGDSQTAVLGMDRRPFTTDAPYKSRLVIVTPIDISNDTIKRSLIDFYQRTNVAGDTARIGRIAFDRSNNLAFGKDAMLVNTTGTNNIGIGINTLLANDIGDFNTAVGVEALKANKPTAANNGDSNTAIGFATSFKNTTGTGNTALGTQALNSNLSGNYNVANGFQTLFYNLGNNNTAVGAGAMTGTDVVSGPTTAAAVDNAAVGFQALKAYTTGAGNTAVGSNALVNNTSGTGNTAVGYQSLGGVILPTPLGVTVQHHNTAVGYQALSGMTYAGLIPPNTNNTALGYQTCTGITLGVNNICIGNQAGPVGDASNKLFIDIAQTNTPLIYGDFTGGAKKLTINGSLAVVGAATYTINGNTITTSSDKRLKNILGDNNVGIEKLNKIHVVNYVFKKDKQKKHKVGVIAQELQKIFPNSVSKMSDGYLGVSTDEMFYAMLNSIKDMYKQVQSLIAKVSGLDTRITKLEKENLVLKTQMAQINKRLDKLEHKK